MKRIIGLILILLSCGTIALASSVPAKLSFQGQYKESSLPYTGTKTFTFNIVNAGHTQQYFTTNQTVQIKNGIYAVELAITKDTLDKNQDLYLQVFDGSTQIGSDILLGSSPYALISNYAEAAGTANYAATAGSYSGVASSANFAATANFAVMANAASNAVTANNILWSGVIGKPATLGGYGITDAQSTISYGTTGQYYRGDKTWQTLNPTAIGAAAATHTHSGSDITSAVANATNASYATGAGTATNVNGGSISATTGTFSGAVVINNYLSVLGPLGGGSITLGTGGNGWTLGTTAGHCHIVSAGGNFYIDAPAYCSAGMWSGSDLRWKKDIQPLNNSLDKVAKLRGVSYLWNREKYPSKNFDEGRQIGFIAQDVEKIIPELVKTDASGYKAVAYDKITAVLVEAVKEQQQMIEKLKKDNQEQQKEIDALKAGIKKLEKQ